MWRVLVLFPEEITAVCVRRVISSLTWKIYFLFRILRDCYFVLFSRECVIFLILDVDVLLEKQQHVWKRYAIFENRV